MRSLALITRPEAQSGELAARLRAKGFTPVTAPLFQIRQRPTTLPAGLQALLVTSGNALAALPASNIPLFAVGDATAARARAAGFTEVYSAGADAAALAGLVTRKLQPRAGALFLASGAGQGASLATDLRARGFPVVRRVCYNAIAVSRFPAEGLVAIACGELGLAVFLSAETAATFVRLLPLAYTQGLASVVALAIGKSTEDALSPLPWLRIRRAKTPTLDEIVALI